MRVDAVVVAKVVVPDTVASPVVVSVENVGVVVTPIVDVPEKTMLEPASK